MKTEQTSDQRDKADSTDGRAIDSRKDTPPTDWLMKRVEERYAHLPEADIKISSDYLKEFIDELSELRCEPVCVNGQLDGGCVCSLVEQLTSSDVDLLVPKDVFLAIVQAAGYSKEDALKQYRNHCRVKLRAKHKPEIERLCRESDNAYNWWLELESDEASAQASEAEDELRALERKIDQELEAIMSA